MMFHMYVKIKMKNPSIPVFIIFYMYVKILIIDSRIPVIIMFLYVWKNPIHQAYLYLHIHLYDEPSHNIFSSYLLHASEKYISLYFTISINQAIIHVE